MTSVTRTSTSTRTPRDTRLRALDPLLPAVHALPEPAEGDITFTLPGAEARYRRRRLDPAAYEASWSALDRHQLHARLTGPDPARALDGLLAAWDKRMAAGGHPAGDAEAVFTWPSRDTEVTPVLLAHGFTPKTVTAVRTTGAHPADTGPPGAGDPLVRPLVPRDPAELDRAVALWLDELRWDEQFGGTVRREASGRHARQRLADPAAWVWVAERDGRITGLLHAEPPANAARAARLTSGRRAGYLATLMVEAADRGAGTGTALVRTAHLALAEAGATHTLLHYAALNPLSGPFWHRAGYRPLWTTWVRRPAPPR
ncbi:GNAT family N-acetyltransferase [Streptomyces carpaticus]|uniref:GNAT family N-acetyltransferase n=1 Tax=Streptomyces TaxID=1883 RepID=UPI0022027550|nr:GNAT family N-acetyltransferase [Streptomyces carpaticus]